MRDPNTSGVAGRAWKVALDAPWVKSAPNSTLVAWFLCVPSAHPFWSWYSISVIHLRDMEGVKPAIRQYPEAEYELIVIALDPGPDRNNHVEYDPDGSEPTKLLMPPNHVIQFHGLSDEQAAELGDRLAMAVCRGLLNPDTDHRRAWTKAVQQLVERYSARLPPEA